MLQTLKRSPIFFASMSVIIIAVILVGIFAFFSIRLY